MVAAVSGFARAVGRVAARLGEVEGGCVEENGEEGSEVGHGGQ